MPEKDKPAGWLDFNLVRLTVPLAEVAQRCGLQSLTQTDDELRGDCPLLDCGGKRSFAINTTKNCFYCHKCKARSSNIDFVMKYEGVGSKEAARLIVGWFPDLFGQNGVGKSANTEAQQIIIEIEERLARLKSLVGM